MATIESLDLATLTNNPQSIAEALEDVLETTSGNLGTLKTNAQNDHDHIEALRTSAQADHDAIEALTGTTTAEHHHYTSGFLNGWSVYDFESTTTDEDGIRVYRMGVIYMVHFSIRRNTGTGFKYETVLNLGSHITHPSNYVYLGQHVYGNAAGTQQESFIASNIDTSGGINIRVYNHQGSDTFAFVSMFGMDVA